MRSPHSDLAIEVGASVAIVLLLMAGAFAVVSLLQWLGVPM